MLQTHRSPRVEDPDQHALPGTGHQWSGPKQKFRSGLINTGEGRNRNRFLIEGNDLNLLEMIIHKHDLRR